MICQIMVQWTISGLLKTMHLCSFSEHAAASNDMHPRCVRYKHNLATQVNPASMFLCWHILCSASAVAHQIYSRQRSAAASTRLDNLLLLLLLCNRCCPVADSADCKTMMAAAMAMNHACRLLGCTAAAAATSIEAIIKRVLRSWAPLQVAAAAPASLLLAVAGCRCG
jgi:hypothetical protein